MFGGKDNSLVSLLCNILLPENNNYVYLYTWPLLRRQENYKEVSWSAMSGLENDLQHLEAQLAQQFGDHSDQEENEEIGAVSCAINGESFVLCAAFSSPSLY